jgi:hypothetical protein
MSLYEVERLVTRLEEYLGPDAQMATMSKDAQEFSGMIKSTNQRLEQVGAMMDAGDLHQAMQLERMEPCLTDLVMQLDFPKSTDFRELCAKNGLEKSPKINRRLVARLNDLYASDLDTLDELWREYNGARLRQDFKAALGVIRRIMKAKPDDKNAQQELFELEKVDFESRFQELEDALNVTDYQRILSLIDLQEPMLKKFQLNTQHQQTWMRVKEMQMKVWIGWLKSYRQNNDWQNCLIWGKRIRDSINLIGIILPPADSQSVEEAGRWAEIKQDEFGEDAAFNQHYIQLQELLGQANLPNREPDMLDLEQCQMELNQLSHAWQNSQQYSQRCTQRIDQQIYDKFRLRSQGLEDRILQLRKKKNVLVAVVCAAALIGLSVGILIFAASGKKKNWVERVELAMGTNLCLTVSNHLATAEKDYGTNSIPQAMTATYTKAKKWLAGKNTEREVVAKEIDNLIQMSKDGFKLEMAEVTSANITTLSNKVTVCCADELIQKELKLALLEVQKPWVKFRNAEKIAGERAINQFVAEVDRVTQEYQKRPDDMFKVLPEVKSQMDAAAPYITNQVISIRQQLRTNYQQAGNTLKKNEDSLKLYRQAMKRLGLLDDGFVKPGEALGELKMDEYLLVLKDLSKSGFLADDYDAGVKEVLRVVQGKYADDIMLSVLFKSSREYMDISTQRRGRLYPQGQLPDEEFWYKLHHNSYYSNMMTNKVEKVKYQWADEFQRPVTRPSGHHMILHVPRVPGGYVYLDIKKPYIQEIWYLEAKKIRLAGKKVFRANIANLVEEYEYPTIVEQYRKFMKRNGLAKTCMEAGPENEVVWEFKTSPWRYLGDLNNAVKTKQINPVIAAYQQKQILNHILQKPINQQYSYGVPSVTVSNSLRSRLRSLGLDDINPITWMDAEYEKKNKEPIAQLQKLATNCLDLGKLNAQVLAVHDGGLDFVGFYKGGAKLYSGKTPNTEGRAIIYITSAGRIAYVKTVSELGDASAGASKNPVEFSPLFILKKTDPDGGLESSSPLYEFLPNILNKSKTPNE